VFELSICWVYLKKHAIRKLCLLRKLRWVAFHFLVIFVDLANKNIRFAWGFLASHLSIMHYPELQPLITNRKFKIVFLVLKSRHLCEQKWLLNNVLVLAIWWLSDSRNRAGQNSSDAPYVFIYQIQKNHCKLKCYPALNSQTSKLSKDMLTFPAQPTR